MAETPNLENSKVLEDDFVKNASSGGFKVDGAIIFSHRDDKFDFLPVAGYPGSPSFSEMSEINLTVAELTIAQRDETFNLKTPQDPIGSDAKVFLRVEEGNDNFSSSLSLTLSPIIIAFSHRTGEDLVNALLPQSNAGTRHRISGEAPPLFSVALEPSRCLVQGLPLHDPDQRSTYLDLGDAAELRLRDQVSKGRCQLFYC